MAAGVEVRSAGADDAAAISALAVGLEMLSDAEAAAMVATIGRPGVDGRDAGADARPDWLCAVTPGGRLVGAAYSAPDPVADGVWTLYFLAVARPQQGRGVGTRLLDALETRLRARPGDPATAVVVETSSLDGFSVARAFYRQRGYALVGQVPDYYGPGDDKVIFWKPVGDRRPDHAP